MDNKDIYIRDYYFLLREKKEKDFIESLNSNKNLFSLVNPYIIQIKNLLFEKIKNKQPIISIKIPNDVNAAFLIQLKQNQILKTTDNHSIRLSDIFKELSNRLFNKAGYINETTSVYEYVYKWLELLLAKAIAADERFSNYKILIDVLRQAENLHNFYGYLVENIPVEWINNDQNWLNVDFNNLLEITNAVGSFKEYFLQYEDILKKYENLTPCSFIKKTTENSGYILFSLEYNFRNNVLYKKDLTKWIEFWDNLRLPILQDIPFYLKTPNEILEITDVLIKKKKNLKSNSSYLACILAIAFFDNIIKITENLAFYTDEKKLNSIPQFQYNLELITKGKELANNWHSEKVKLYNDFIKKLTKLLTIDNIEEWVFDYKYRTTPQNEYTVRYNKEIAILTSAYSKYVKNKTDIKRNFNLQKFNFYTNLLREKKIQIKAEDLLNELLVFINKDEFYWNNLFVDPFWRTFKNIGFLLSITEYPTDYAIDKILNKIKVFYEGWNINNISYESTEKEVFILNGLLMLFEYPEAFKNKTQKKEYLKFLLNHIITQYRFSDYRKSEYLPTFQIISLIVNQIYTEQKQYFENEIISYIDDIGDVLKIFAVDEYKLEEKSLKRLKYRIKKELLIYKRKIDRRNNKQEIENIDKITEKMGLI